MPTPKMVVIHKSRGEALGYTEIHGAPALPVAILARSLLTHLYAVSFVVLFLQVAHPSPTRDRLPTQVLPLRNQHGPADPWNCLMTQNHQQHSWRPWLDIKMACHCCVLVDSWFWGIITKGLPTTPLDSGPHLYVFNSTYHLQCSEIFSKGRKKLNHSPLYLLYSLF